MYVYLYGINIKIFMQVLEYLSGKKTTVDVLKDFEVMIYIAKLTSKIVSNLLLPSSLMNNRYYILKVLQFLV